MNKSERLMNERMTFVSRRGRTADYLRDEWLRNLRTKRLDAAHPWTIVVAGWAEYTAPTIRRGKILGLGILSELKFRGRGKAYPMTVEIYCRNTRVKVWDRELN